MVLQSVISQTKHFGGKNILDLANCCSNVELLMSHTPKEIYIVKIKLVIVSYKIRLC